MGIFSNNIFSKIFKNEDLKEMYNFLINNPESTKFNQKDIKELRESEDILRSLEEEYFGENAGKRKVTMKSVAKSISKNNKEIHPKLKSEITKKLDKKYTQLQKRKESELLEEIEEIGISKTGMQDGEIFKGGTMLDTTEEISGLNKSGFEFLGR